ncbi:MAG: tetratricopeptide repeat protein [Moraxella sp.]|nr:tetratricopeptide repeat protein [Moraxella sp.]
MGYCYERGLGVVQDVNQAIRWYQESAKRGDVISAPAMIALGRLYEQGLGVEKDINQAISLYRQALNAGDDSAKAALERLQTRP